MSFCRECEEDVTIVNGKETGHNKHCSEWES